MFFLRLLVLLPLLAHPALCEIGFANCTSLFFAGLVPFQFPAMTPMCKLGTVAVGYDTNMTNPGFVAYYVTPAEIKAEKGGRLSFNEDPDLLAANIHQAPVNSEIFGETWNRGHNCPSAIMSYDKSIQAEIYFMSNIAPQNGNFNQVSWANLEVHVRGFILNTSTALHIITGVGYMDRGLADRPYDNIAIPSYYYKVLCDPVGKKSVGFYGDNADGGGGQTYTFRTVQYIEKNIYGGQLFDASCNTNTVDQNQWWSF